MYGFEHNDVDPHDVIPIRTLKVLLRTNLPNLQPRIQRRIEEVFEDQLNSSKAVKGSSQAKARCRLRLYSFHRLGTCTVILLRQESHWAN